MGGRVRETDESTDTAFGSRNKRCVRFLWGFKGCKKALGIHTASTQTCGKSDTVHQQNKGRTGRVRRDRRRRYVIKYRLWDMYVGMYLAGGPVNAKTREAYLCLYLHVSSPTPVPFAAPSGPPPRLCLLGRPRQPRKTSGGHLSLPATKAQPVIYIGHANKEVRGGVRGKGDASSLLSLLVFPLLGSKHAPSCVPSELWHGSEAGKKQTDASYW